MLKDRREDAPKIVNVGVWATAVVGVFVFALTVGIGLYNTVNSPISASTSVASCPSGTKKLALNNYPTTYFTTKVDGKLPSHQPYESAMDNNWRCSEYCVPITSGETDQQAVEKFLTGATMGGKSVVIAKTEQSFLNMLQSDKANMVNTVILTSTKGSCQGAAQGSTSGASVDYPELKTKGATTPTSPVVKNETVKQVEEARKSAAELQAATEAGIQDNFNAPVAGEIGDSGIAGSNSLKEEIEAFKWCKATIKKFTTQANSRLVGASLIERNKVLEIDSSTLKTLEAARKAKERCWKISDYIQGRAESWTPDSSSEDANQGSQSGPLSGVKTNGFNIYISGYLDYAPNKPSDNTIVCAFLIPLDGGYLKGTSYNRCATSSKGAFNLSLGFGKSQFFKDNGKPPFKQVWVYAVNSGGFWGRAKNQLYSINLEDKFANLSSAQKAKGSMTINVGGTSSKHDALNGRIIEDGNVSPARPTTQQLRDEVFNKTKVNCLSDR